MLSKKMIKVICIIMAALMVISAFAVCLKVFEVGADAMQYVPVTGDNDGDYIIPVAIAVVAILAVVICLVLPKLKKK